LFVLFNVFYLCLISTLGRCWQ